jgi:hypothetical protein
MPGCSFVSASASASLPWSPFQADIPGQSIQCTWNGRVHMHHAEQASLGISQVHSTVGNISSARTFHLWEPREPYQTQYGRSQRKWPNRGVKCVQPLILLLIVLRVANFPSYRSFATGFGPHCGRAHHRCLAAPLSPLLSSSKSSKQAAPDLHNHPETGKLPNAVGLALSKTAVHLTSD